MKKSILILSILFSAFPVIASCPDLSGVYKECSQDEHSSIEPSIIKTINDKGIYTYSFTEISSGGEWFLVADGKVTTQIDEESGYTETRKVTCSNNTLVVDSVIEREVEKFNTKTVFSKKGSSLSVMISSKNGAEVLTQTCRE